MKGMNSLLLMFANALSKEEMCKLAIDKSKAYLDNPTEDNWKGFETVGMLISSKMAVDKLGNGDVHKAIDDLDKSARALDAAGIDIPEKSYRGPDEQPQHSDTSFKDR